MKKFFLLKERVGHEVGPNFPQSTAMEDGYNMKGPHGVYELMKCVEELPEFTPNLGKVILLESAILTDVLSTAYFNSFIGKLINKRTLDIFLAFKLPVCGVYPVNVLHKGQQYQYFWFHIISKEHQVVDFTNSVFKITTPIGDKIENFVVNTLADFQKKRHSINKSFLIKPEVLCLKENMLDLDLFRIGIGLPNLIVSKELAASLQEKGITGLELKQIPNWIYVR